MINQKTIKISNRDITVTTGGEVYSEEYVDPCGRRFARKKRKPCLASTGYHRLRITVDGKPESFFIHRLVAEAFLPDFSDELQVDHINGDKTDNRLENLRMVTHKQNQRSFRKKMNGASSIYRGVSRRENRWVARCCVNGVSKHIGRFGSEEEAALGFNDFARKNGWAEEGLNVLP